MPDRDERQPRVAVVVPCYDEAGRLDADEFLQFADGRNWLQFVFVDDGSRDGTRELLASMERQRPDQVRMLGFAQNQGKGEAVRRGLLMALESEPSIVGFWDADLATPLSEIETQTDWLEAHPHVEMVLGSRVRMLGRRIERNPRRHYFGRVAATAASAVLGMSVYDTQCGAKLFRANDTLRIILSERFLTRWIFDVEILARWLRARPQDRERVECFIHELPVTSWRDVSGSRLKPRDFVLVPMDLWRIQRHYRN